MPKQKEKKVQKTKEQIKQEFEQQEKVKQLRGVVKNQLYPALLENSESIEDAKMILYVLTMTIRQAILNKQRGWKVSDLDIPVTDEKFKRYENVLKLFTDKEAAETAELLEGMRDTIDSFVKEENQKRKLAELPVVLLD